MTEYPTILQCVAGILPLVKNIMPKGRGTSGESVRIVESIGFAGIGPKPTPMDKEKETISTAN